jgi:G3E family GTPase
VLDGGAANDPDTADPDDSVFDHDGAHRSRTLLYDAPLDRAELVAEIERLPDDVVRVKGLVALTDDPDRAWSVQRVGARIELERLDSAPPERSQIVVIATGPG